MNDLLMKPLFQKMHVKPDQTVALLLEQPELLKYFSQELENFSSKLIESYDVIVAAFIQSVRLTEDIKSIDQHLHKSGVLWIVYPKAQALKNLHSRIPVPNSQ